MTEEGFQCEEPCEERDAKRREGTRPSLANEREATAGAVPGGLEKDWENWANLQSL